MQEKLHSGPRDGAAGVEFNVHEATICPPQGVAQQKHTWMDLEDIVLGDRRQAQTDTQCVTPFTGSLFTHGLTLCGFNYPQSGNMK